MGIVNGFDVQLQSEALSYYHIFDVKQFSYHLNLYLFKHPTQNCQLSSIGRMDDLFFISSVKDDVQAIIRECCNIIDFCPKLILLDVNKEWISSVEECFTVITRTSYVNTNGSSMCLFIVKLE